MPSVPAFVSHCLELLAPLGAVRARRMFGGHGLYVDEVFVALIADERLYMKTDDTSRAAFERAGCEPFAYSRRDRAAVTLGYWTAPERGARFRRARWSPGHACRWRRRCVPRPASLGDKGVAQRSRRAQRPRDKRRPAATKASKARAAKARG